MTEIEYINSTNLVKCRNAILIIKDICVDDIITNAKRLILLDTLCGIVDKLEKQIIIKT